MTETLASRVSKGSFLHAASPHDPTTFLCARQLPPKAGPGVSPGPAHGARLNELSVLQVERQDGPGSGGREPGVHFSVGALILT